MSVEEALCRRRSCRAFEATRLSVEQVAQLCWAAQGITDADEGLRTAPSAGALFPITVLVVDADGVCRYEPRHHRLERTIAGDLRSELQSAALDQPCVGAAPLCLAIAIDVGHCATKYGRRSERYCLLETGHVAQNVLLQATALGLVGVPLGAFDDERMSAVLGLSRSLRAVYLIPIGGRPRA